MDLFIRNIPYTASQFDLLEYFARVLHDPDLTVMWADAPQQINFKVELNRDRSNRGRLHGGTGILIVPTESRLASSFPSNGPSRTTYTVLSGASNIPSSTH